MKATLIVLAAVMFSAPVVAQSISAPEIDKLPWVAEHQADAAGLDACTGKTAACYEQWRVNWEASFVRKKQAILARMAATAQSKTDLARLQARSDAIKAQIVSKASPCGPVAPAQGGAAAIPASAPPAVPAPLVMSPASPPLNPRPILPSQKK